MPYILEAEKNGKHYGYMKAIFTKHKYAESYYNLYNSHLRPINAFKNYTSAYDSKTGLRWKIVEFKNQILNIYPFTEYDAD